MVGLPAVPMSRLGRRTAEALSALAVEQRLPLIRRQPVTTGTVQPELSGPVLLLVLAAPLWVLLASPLVVFSNLVAIAFPPLVLVGANRLTLALPTGPLLGSVSCLDCGVLVVSAVVPSLRVSRMDRLIATGLHLLRRLDRSGAGSRCLRRRPRPDSFPRNPPARNLLARSGKGNCVQATGSAHLGETGGLGVAGSNPVAPTTYESRKGFGKGLGRETRPYLAAEEGGRCVFLCGAS